VLIVDRQPDGLNIKELWFADKPFEVEADVAVFFSVRNVTDGYRMLERFTMIIDLTQSLDEIWGGMKNSSCRYPIKRGVREGVVVEESRDFRAFMAMDVEFRKCKGLSPRSQSKYDSFSRGVLLLARIGGEIIAGHIYFSDGRTTRWIAGCSKRLSGRHQIVGFANRLLIWEAIKYAKNNGNIEFDLGGYYVGKSNKEKENINFFKESFGGKRVKQFYTCKYYSFAAWLRVKFFKSLR
jgi:hypothetical protein